MCFVVLHEVVTVTKRFPAMETRKVLRMVPEIQQKLTVRTSITLHSLPNVCYHRSLLQKLLIAHWASVRRLPVQFLVVYELEFSSERCTTIATNKRVEKPMKSRVHHLKYALYQPENHKECTVLTR